MTFLMAPKRTPTRRNVNSLAAIFGGGCGREEWRMSDVKMIRDLHCMEWVFIGKKGEVKENILRTCFKTAIENTNNHQFCVF